MIGFIGTSMFYGPLVKSHLANYFRVFFPSWKFFNEVGWVPRVYFQYGEHQEHPLNWEFLWTSVDFRPWHFFLNPKTNLNYALESICIEVVREAQLNNKSLENSTAFKLLDNAVKMKIRYNKNTKPKFYYRFKVVSFDGVKPVEVLIQTPFYFSEAI